MPVAAAPVVTAPAALQPIVPDVVAPVTILQVQTDASGPEVDLNVGMAADNGVTTEELQNEAD